MPLHLLYGDDFSGYANQIAMENAYPYDPPGDLTSCLSGSPDNPYVRWGLTNGPSGVPGNQNVTYDDGGSHHQFGLDLDKVGLDPQCRLFQAEGTWDLHTFAPEHPLNGSSTMITVWSYETGNRLGSFDGNLVVVGRLHGAATVVVTVTTTPPYANNSPPPGSWKGLFSQSFVGAMPEATISTLRVYGRRSELTEVTAGEWAPSTDGFVQVFLNDVQIFSFEGPVWHGNHLIGSRHWNSVTWEQVGRFTNARVWDEIGCDPTEPPPCPCVPPPTGPPKLPPPIPPRPPKTPPVIGMQLACLGGGLVPTQPDLVYLENWWGL